MMKNHTLFFLILAAVVTAVWGGSKQPPAPKPEIGWDRTFLSPSAYRFENERELYISWQYSQEAASSLLHIDKRAKDDSTDWTSVYTGPVSGMAALNDNRLGEWFGIVTLDEKLYVWVEYVAPPIVHTNGVYHLSGVYHAMDTDDPKYVAPTIDVKFVGDDDGESSKNWKAYGAGPEIDDEAWEDFVASEQVANDWTVYINKE